MPCVPFVISAAAALCGLAIPSYGLVTAKQLATSPVPPCACATDVALAVEKGRARAAVKYVPDTAWLIDDGVGECVAEGSPAANTSVTVVLKKGPIICQSAVMEEVRLNRVSSDFAYYVGNFTLSKAMPAGGKERVYVEAWPVVQDTCTSGSPCPVVVHLHGAGEHGYPNKLPIWALLNYYVKDQACRRSLRSVLLFPQLEPGETWSADGPQCFDSFMIPLLDGFLQNHPAADSDRAALVGYSEGAVGAVLGAMLYPSRFDLAAAGSPTLPDEDFIPKLSFHVGDGPSKLKAIILSWGSEDTLDVSRGVKFAFSKFERAAIANRVRIRARYYMGELHMGAPEALLNHYAPLHEILWGGQWDKLSEL